MSEQIPAKYFDSLNFQRGCTKHGPGCLNCWAETFHNRFHLGKNPKGQYIEPFSKMQYFYDKLSKGVPGGKPKTYLVNSMSDTFHSDVNFARATVQELCRSPRQHKYLLLTKRPERMLDVVKHTCSYLGEKELPDHVWAGGSICTQKEADENIPLILQTQATNLWLSLEPMLEGIDMAFEPRDKNFWIVVGCESGSKPRLCHLDHIYSVVEQCQNAEIPVFVKQIPINGKCVHDWDKWPSGYDDLKIRQFPWEATP